MLPGEGAGSALAKVAGATAKLALGLTRELSQLKRRVPSAQNYSDLGLEGADPELGDKLLALMKGSKEIHFNVSGMRYLNTPDGVLAGPAGLNIRGSTNWELRTYPFTTLGLA